MYCEVNFISEAYVCEGSEYLLELRSIKDHMVISDVIASRAYNDIVSSHIMLLTEYLFAVCGHMCNTVGLESCVIKTPGKSRNV